MAESVEKCRVVVEGRIPKRFGIARAELKSAAERFAERSRARVGNPAWHEVVVHLVDDAGSDAVHRAIMGLEGATDVVTQAYDAIPPERPGLFGELFVNVDQAMRRRRNARGGASRRSCCCTWRTGSTTFPARTTLTMRATAQCAAESLTG